MNIVITENKEEMIKLGKEYCEEKKDIYTPKMVQTIYSTIDRIRPNITNEERESIFYTSIYDYWIYGNNVGEELFYNFANLSHEEKLSYITFRNRFMYMTFLNKKEDEHYMHNKYETYQLLEPYYKRDVMVIRGTDDFDAFCDFVRKHKEFVVKPSDLALSIGVHKVDSTEYSDMHVLFNEILKQGVDSKNNYRWGGSSDIVLEELIIQPDSIGKFHAHSICNIRCTSLLKNGQVYILGAFLRVGVNDNFLASASTGGIEASINIENGIIETNGFTENCEQFESHPNTGIVFKGFEIPQWNELIKLVKEVAVKFPTIRYVGWDLALSVKGWCIVEANQAGEFVGPQITKGHGIRKEFEKLIEWTPDKNYWWE